MTQFVVDTNVLMEAKNTYYAFDIVPRFWDELCPHIESGRIVIIKNVYDEILKGDKEEELVVWTRKHKSVCKECADNKVVEHYGDMATWIANQSRYQNSRRNFLDGADLWLIAYARAYGQTVVTMEERLQEPRNSTKLKVPNICDQFGVNCIRTYDMLRGLNLAIR